MLFMILNISILIGRYLPKINYYYNILLFKFKKKRLLTTINHYPYQNKNIILSSEYAI